MRADPDTEAVERFPLPASTGYTVTFGNDGILRFTGQSGIYGRLDPDVGVVEVFQSPRGRGPYGIDATPDGDGYYASLAGSYLGHIDTDTAEVTVFTIPSATANVRQSLGRPGEAWGAKSGTDKLIVVRTR